MNASSFSDYFSRRLFRSPSGKAGCSCCYTGGNRQMLPRPLLSSCVVCFACHPAKPVAAVAMRTQMMNASSSAVYFSRRFLRLSSGNAVYSCRYTGCNRQILPRPLFTFRVICSGYRPAMLFTATAIRAQSQMLPYPLFTFCATYSDCRGTRPVVAAAIRRKCRMFPRPLFNSRAVCPACRPAKLVAAASIRVTTGKCSPAQ